jgi:hypothetical protein
MMLKGRVVALVMALAAVTTAGCESPTDDVDAETSESTPSPATVEESSLPSVARRLGAAPTNCPGPHPRRQQVSPAYAPLIGERPLWAGFYARYDRGAHAFIARDARRTKHGFRIKVLWVMSPTRDIPVTISGHNIASRAALRFDIEEVADKGIAASLDPDVAGVGEGGWREFPSYLYFDGAGCFRLTASWDETSWDLTFGFGR